MTELSRDVLAPLILCALAVLVPNVWVTYAFILTGQAHFLLAYIYQYRAGRMNKKYLSMVSIVFIGILAYLILIHRYIPILLATAFFFALHFAVDEFFLRGESNSVGKTITTASFTLLFFTLVLQLVYPSLEFLSWGMAMLIIVSILVRFLLKSSRPSLTEYYLWIVELLLVVIALGFGMAEKVLGIIIVLHVLNWYIGYGIKVHPNPIRARRYWIDVAWTISLSALLFVIFLYVHVPILGYFFLPIFYDCWALMHFVVSSRYVSGAKKPIFG